MRLLTVRLDCVLKNAGISPMLGVHLPRKEFLKFKNSGWISWAILTNTPKEDARPKQLLGE